jgi:hypothetical protein
MAMVIVRLVISALTEITLAFFVPQDSTALAEGTCSRLNVLKELSTCTSGKKTVLTVPWGGFAIVTECFYR